MKIYNYKNGEKAVFINNVKTIISANAALLLEHFQLFLGDTILKEEHNIILPELVQPADEKLLLAANTKNYTVKATTIPTNGKEVIVLSKNEIPIIMKFEGRAYDAGRPEIRVQLEKLNTLLNKQKNDKQ